MKHARDLWNKPLFSFPTLFLYHHHVKRPPQAPKKISYVFEIAFKLFKRDKLEFPIHHIVEVFLQRGQIHILPFLKASLKTKTLEGT